MNSGTKPNVALMSAMAEAASTTFIGGGGAAFAVADFLACAIIWLISFLNFASSVGKPLSTVLHFRVMADIATASPTSASDAPFRRAKAVCPYVQYLHGI